MRIVERPGANARSDARQRITDGIDVLERKCPDRGLALELGQLGPDARGREGTNECDHVAVAEEAEPPRARRIRQLADHSDHRRRQDRAVRRFVVQRDIAADDGDSERLARLAHPLHGLGELPRDMWLLRVAEVQAVRQPERLGADAREVRRASNTASAAPARGIAGNPAPVAIDRHRDRAGTL